jgi:transcriptional regulator with XRE-family HTH domain
MKQREISKETGLSQQEVSRTQKAIREGKNLLRKNVYKVAQAMGIPELTVEIELNEVEK